MFLWLIVWPLLGSMIICFYKESRNLVGNGTHNLDISIYFSSLSDHIIFRLIKWRERRHCWQLYRLRRWFCDCIKKLRILISYNLEMIIFLPKAKACCFYSTCQRAWKKVSSSKFINTVTDSQTTLNKWIGGAGTCRGHIFCFLCITDTTHWKKVYHQYATHWKIKIDDPIANP